MISSKYINISAGIILVCFGASSWTSSERPNYQNMCGATNILSVSDEQSPIYEDLQI